MKNKNIFYNIKTGVLRKTKKSENNLINLFTYGILKYPHRLKQEGATDIIENAYVLGQRMYVIKGGSFPVTKITGNNKDIVYGSLFKIPLEIVSGYYDIIEGYSMYREKRSNMYNREMVDVYSPTGEIVRAYQYIANYDWFSDILEDDNLYIPTGNFDDKDIFIKQKND